MAIQVISDELATKLDNLTPETKAMGFGKVLKTMQEQMNTGGTPGTPAILDENGKLPLSNMPATVFQYKGAYNATTNSPSLADGSGDSGDTYRVTIGGTQNFGSGNITFAAGDKVVYNGSTWEKWDVQDENVKTYITQQATNTRVTAAGPSSLGNYRSYLRAASARTYSETNGSPTTGPSTSNGYLLYSNRSFAAGDSNNEPSRYEIYIGLNKEPIFEFYRNAGRTGKIFPDMFYAWAGGNYDGGCVYGYDPATGIAWITKAYPSGGTVAAGMDETTTPIAGNIYFDIKC